ncbi:MAG: hypothetical protein ACFNUN_10020, partial [Aggregatibacter sp.]
TSEVKINPETKTLIRDGVESIINPDDKNDLEAALKLKAYSFFVDLDTFVRLRLAKADLN